MAAFYEAGAASRLAINLFHGWGYNFYRAENRLRADDLMIRAKVCEMLGAAQGLVEAAEARFRREHLPPPSRENPRPAPEAILGAQTLEAFSHALGALEGQIRALPAPESDRMTERFRREADTLVRLAETDEAMIGHAAFLRALLEPMSGQEMTQSAGEIGDCTAAIRTLIRARADLLAF